MFSNIIFVFLLKGISPLQLSFMKQNVKAKGGQICDTKFDAIKTAVAANGDKTEVVVLAPLSINRSILKATIGAESEEAEKEMTAYKIVRQEWLTDSLKHNKVMDFAKYLVPAWKEIAETTVESRATTAILSSDELSRKRPREGSNNEDSSVLPFFKKMSENEGATSKIKTGAGLQLHEFALFTSKATAGDKKRETTEFVWEEYKGEPKNTWLIYTRGRKISDAEKSKVASFDIDGTIVNTKSGGSFPKSPSDWVWFSPQVPKKLAELHENGYQIVFFTNQMGIGKGRVSKTDAQKRIQNILEQLPHSVSVYVAPSDDLMRKPRTGMWDFMVQHHRSSAPSASDSFFVGDAAGRPKEGKRRKDFSAGDWKFALNIGIKFYTPEEFFLGSKQKLHTSRSKADVGFNPLTLTSCGISKLDKHVQIASQMAAGEDQLEVLVLVGAPGAGKSFLCKKYLRNYGRVNQDTLKTLPKCVEEAKKHLHEGRSVVIDSQNKSIETRRKWIQLAQSFNARARCIFVNVSKERCFHLNIFRKLAVHGDAEDDSRSLVPSMVIHAFYKRSEGFMDVVEIKDEDWSVAESLPPLASRLIGSHLLP